MNWTLPSKYQFTWSETVATTKTKESQSAKTKERRAAAQTRRSTNSRSGSSKTKLPGVLAFIKEEHDEVKKLFDTFEKQTEDDPAAGLETAQQICMELTRHAEMEEKILYPKLQEEDEDLYYEANEEHHVAKVLIQEIESMKPDPMWRAKVTVLAESVRHHIDEEESDGFKELKSLDNEVLEEMGRQWEEMKASWKPSAASRRKAS
jgi:hemerythrin superfamily protein